MVVYASFIDCILCLLLPLHSGFFQFCETMGQTESVTHMTARKMSKKSFFRKCLPSLILHFSIFMLPFRMLRQQLIPLLLLFVAVAYLFFYFLYSPNAAVLSASHESSPHYLTVFFFCFSLSFSHLNMRRSGKTLALRDSVTS